MTGIPFMITQAMKDALHARGRPDDEIGQLTPEEAHKILSTPDLRAVVDFVATIIAQAQAATKHLRDPGVLQTILVHPSAERVSGIYRYELNNPELVERMAADALNASEARHNVYIEGRTVRRGLGGKERGGLEDTIAVFALVVDSDTDKGKAWTPTVPVSLTVETSPGNHHYWLFLQQAVDATTAQKLGERLRKATGGDQDTGVITQPYRVAGTVNYPNKTKLERGRIVTWTRSLAFDPEVLWTPERFEQDFPPPPRPTNGGGAGSALGSGDEAGIPADTLRVIRDGLPEGQRSEAFWNVVLVLKDSGWSINATVALLEKYPDGIARKYEGRLRQEVERIWNKLGNGRDTDKDDDHSADESLIHADTWAALKDPSAGGREFFNIMIALKALGFTVDRIVALLERFPDGIAAKYRGRLHHEVERVYAKIKSDPTKPEDEQSPPLDCEPWWRDPTTIPQRAFLQGKKHFARKNIGASIGAGGRLKTTHGLFECIEMAVGRELTTKAELPGGPLRAALLNAEEDQDELDRRTAAICQRYGITEADLGGRLFVKSVYDHPMRFATMVQSTATLNQTALEQLANFIQDKQLDVWMLDPWISFHSVNENSNPDMDLVIKEGLKQIAATTNSAGEIFHHPGKPKPGVQDTTVEDARGASAIIWAVRSARVFNFMTPDEATKLGIPEDARRLHVRIANGKANMAPIGTATWIKIEVENLPNGDEIACASPWKPPDPFQGVSTADMHKCRTLAQTAAYRADSRSPDWVGYMIAEVLKINVVHGADNKPEDIARIKQILKKWLKNKVLKIDSREDEHRHQKQFVVPGSWSDNSEADPDPEEIILQ